MDDYLLWLLAITGLGLLAGALWLRRRAARHRAVQQAQDDRLAAERAQAERVAAEQRLEAAEQAEREQIAAAEAEADAVREAQRRVAEQAAREDAARAEAHLQAALRAEELRVAAQRAEAERAEAVRVEAVRVEAERVEAERVEAERVEAERVEAARSAAELSAAQVERERLALLQAERAAAAQRRVVKTAAQTLVLVADDSKVVRIKTGRLLAQHHYQVAYASDGLDAVQQMQARLPDVLITDVEMPGLDGFELTRQLRADPQTARLPVIMITAADDRHRAQAEAAGVSVLLGKPYPEDALIAHIRQALGQDTDAVLATSNSAHGALA